MKINPEHPYTEDFFEKALLKSMVLAAGCAKIKSDLG
jgi:hypothetical protein